MRHINNVGSIACSLFAVWMLYVSEAFYFIAKLSLKGAAVLGDFEEDA